MISRMSNFRWLGYVGDAFSYYVLHYYPYEHQTLSILLFLVVLALALLFLQRTFAPLLDWEHLGTQRRLVFWGITSLCFVNVLTAELFYFTESFLIFKTSLLLAMVGCWMMSRRRYAGGVILLFLAPMFYQMAGVYAALVLCALAYLEEKGEPSRQLTRKLILYMAAALAGVVIDYGTGNWIVKQISRRVGYDIIPGKSVSIGSFSEYVSNLTRGLHQLYESSLGLMMPVWLPLLFSLVISAVVIVQVCRFGNRQMLGLYLLYKVGSFLLMCCIEIISPPTEFVCRVICPFYTMQSMNALIAWYWICRGRDRGRMSRSGAAEEWKEDSGINCTAWSEKNDARFPNRNENEKLIHDEAAEKERNALHDRQDRLEQLVVLMVTGYVLAQIFFAQIIIANRLLSETLDIQYAEEILDYIADYEEENGTDITEVSFCVDDNYNAYYPQVNYCHTAINYRIAGEATYSLVETVAGWSGRHVGRGSMSQEVYEEYFAGKNWECFQPEEQIVVLDGIMYCCVY